MTHEAISALQAPEKRAPLLADLILSQKESGSENQEESKKELNTLVQAVRSLPDSETRDTTLALLSQTLGRIGDYVGAIRTAQQITALTLYANTLLQLTESVLKIPPTSGTLSLSNPYPLRDRHYSLGLFYIR